MTPGALSAVLALVAALQAVSLAFLASLDRRISAIENALISKGVSHVSTRVR